MGAIAAGQAALARGDVLIAYDEATAVLAEDPGDLEARFVLSLALARAGAWERASDAVEELRRRIERSDSASQRLRQDADALLARLAKDRALQAQGADRSRLCIEAARLYELVAERYGGHFPRVNAATLWLLAGESERAHEMAEQALRGIEEEPDDYWRLASEAEAALVTGDQAQAAAALRGVEESGLGDAAARARTRSQLTLVCRATGQDEGLLAALAVPSVLHYCGHRASGDEVRGAVDAFLDQRNVGVAFGSLARGADIVMAEALLQRDVELHVVLPFDVDDFESISVGSTSEWHGRYRSCLEQAASTITTCDSFHLGDDALLSYASRIAMGHALNRAELLGADVAQLAVWDGQPTASIAGTARDVEVWRQAGGATHVVAVPPTRHPAGARAQDGPSSRICAIVFADFHGFSRLRDENYASFVGEILDPIATEIQRFGRHVLYRNTWGDAIQLVVDDVVSAAHCALRIQEVLSTVDREKALLPPDLSLRMALHVGRVISIDDPIRAIPAFWGRELTRAARIEPRTPEGEVYTTDAVAALLALEPASGVHCEYMGRATTAKEFETIPMYRLRRAPSERG